MNSGPLKPAGFGSPSRIKRAVLHGPTSAGLSLMSVRSHSLWNETVGAECSFASDPAPDTRSFSAAMDQALGCWSLRRKGHDSPGPDLVLWEEPRTHGDGQQTTQHGQVLERNRYNCRARSSSSTSFQKA